MQFDSSKITCLEIPFKQGTLIILKHPVKSNSKTYEFKDYDLARIFRDNNLNLKLLDQSPLLPEDFDPLSFYVKPT